MQRLFDASNANVFANEPTDEFNINRLAQLFQMKTDEKSKDINKLLFSVQTFIAATSPDFQAIRDKKITEARIITILDNVGNELKKFSEKYKSNLADHLVAKEALLYCERAMLDQLNLLDKNDKIYLYYTAHNNTLKDILKTYAKPNNAT